MAPTRTTKSKPAKSVPGTKSVSTATTSSKAVSTPTQLKPTPKAQKKLPARKPPPASTLARQPLLPIVEQTPQVSFLSDRGDSVEDYTDKGQADAFVGQNEHHSAEFVDVGATLSQLHALGGKQVEDDCNRKYKRSIKQTDDEVIVATLERVEGLLSGVADGGDELELIEHCGKLLGKANAQYDQILVAVDQLASELAPKKVSELGRAGKTLQKRGRKTHELHREYVAHLKHVRDKKARKPEVNEVDRLAASLNAMLRI